MVEPCGDVVSHNDREAYRFSLDCYKFKGELFVYARRLFAGGSNGNAEDLVDTTILKAIEHMHQFQPGTNLKAWLYRILSNLFLNQKREERRRSELLAREADNIANNYRCDEVDDQIYNIRIQTFVSECRAALDNGYILDFSDVDISVRRILEVKFSSSFVESYRHVNANYRVVFALVDLLEFSYQEVAQIFGIPIGTVMSRLYRARNDFSTDGRIMDMASAYVIGAYVEGRRSSKVKEGFSPTQLF